MPRLFTGLEIPTNVANDLAMLQSGLPGARWVDPGDFHVTLSFIGDIAPGAARDVAEELARIAKPGFHLRLSGLDVFGAKKPSTIYARVVSHEPRDDALAALQAAHVSLMRRLGVPQEKRRFTPHVTLARGLARCRPVDIAKYMGRTAGHMSAPFEVERFVLYSARDSVGGGPYLVEQAYPLTAVPA